MLSSELSRLLQSSGAGGVFLTPKSKDASGPSTEFKVIWGDSDDLSKDLIVAHTNSAIFGVVKGRDCLGWRVKVKEYVAARIVSSRHGRRIRIFGMTFPQGVSSL